MANNGNWLTDVLGLSPFFDDTPDDYYQQAVKGLYDTAERNKLSQVGNEENAAVSRMAQAAAQHGITGPAAAGMQAAAVQGAQHAGNMAVNDLDAQARAAQYQALIQDRQMAQAKQAAKEQALFNLGVKGVGLLSGGLGLAGKAGWINKDTPFLGGLGDMLGQTLPNGAAAIPKQNFVDYLADPEALPLNMDFDLNNQNDWINAGTVR